MNGRLQEGALLVSAQGESLQHLVKSDLVFAVQSEQEPTELVFEVVHLAEVAVAAFFVLLQEIAAETSGFAGGCLEALVDVFRAESARPHRGSERS